MLLGNQAIAIPFHCSLALSIGWTSAQLSKILFSLNLMTLGNLVELDVIRGFTKFGQKNRPGSALSTVKTMIETHNEYCMGPVGVDVVNNRFLLFLWSKPQVTKGIRG